LSLDDFHYDQIRIVAASAETHRHFDIFFERLWFIDMAVVVTLKHGNLCVRGDRAKGGVLPARRRMRWWPADATWALWNGDDATTLGHRPSSLKRRHLLYS
jgi:hypothetical protein